MNIDVKKLKQLTKEYEDRQIQLKLEQEQRRQSQFLEIIDSIQDKCETAIATGHRCIDIDIDSQDIKMTDDGPTLINAGKKVQEELTKHGLTTRLFKRTNNPNINYALHITWMD